MTEEMKRTERQYAMITAAKHGFHDGMRVFRDRPERMYGTVRVGRTITGASCVELDDGTFVELSASWRPACREHLGAEGSEKSDGWDK